MSAPAQLREKHEGAYGERAALRLWLRLLSCTMVIEKRIQRRLTDRFQSTLPRFDVLAALQRHPEGMTMGALSQVLLVSNGNVTGLVRSLASDGFVAVNSSSEDRRVTVVRLTEAGRDHFEAAAAAHHQWIEEFFAGLDGSDQDHLYALLGKLKQSISTNANHEDTR